MGMISQVLQQNAQDPKHNCPWKEFSESKLLDPAVRGRGRRRLIGVIKFLFPSNSIDAESECLAFYGVQNFLEICFLGKWIQS